MSESKGEPRRRSRRSSSGRQATPPWPPQPGTGLALAGVLPIFLAHYFYAGLNNNTGFSLILAMGLVLAVCLVRRDLRQDLMRLRGLEVPGILFSLVITLALLSLTPYAPGGPHPVWEFTGQGPGSTSIDTSSTSAEIIKLLGLSVIFLVGAITGSSDRRARIAIWLILGLGLALGLWAIFGPVLQKERLGSVGIIQRLLQGEPKALPRLGFNIVDVRDLALAHVRAMTEPQAAGQRFILMGDALWYGQVADTLRQRLGTGASKVPTARMPDFVTRLLALRSAQMKSLLPLLGRTQPFSSEKAKAVLGFAPRPPQDTVTDCAASLLAGPSRS